ncbi:MAG: dihydrofolate reductase [Candidatus Amulumruptor caecigallinarius]|nr:dihydrofolate reductase [Candidatus Amulumruptor caecigallinarius]MCM1396377.1 dihydrofolate reductase [Candidatus Amulumruptor caecigallinarius]MCM1453681.1 dihydrofolate reductase [bacterium]
MKSNTLPSNIIIIAALCRNGAIGRRGELLFHLSEDLRRFKGLTMGSPIIMGRKTWESMPKGALPGRRNIVVTRTPGYHAEGADVASSLEQALCMSGPSATPYVIGGGQIYAQALKYATRMELTHIDDDGPRDADTFFPKFRADEWEETNRSPLYKDEKSGKHFVFASYLKKKPNFAP